MKYRVLKIILVILAINLVYYFVRKNYQAPELPVAKTTLITSTGQEFDWKMDNDKVRIVSFYQTWCGDCRREMPELMQLKQHFGEKIEVLMISDEPFEKVTPMIDYLKVDLTFLQSGTPLKQLGIRRYPTTYLLDTKGKKVAVKVEGIDWYNEEMIKTIAALLK